MFPYMNILTRTADKGWCATKCHKSLRVYVDSSARLTLLTTSFAFQVFVVLMLICGALTMPSSRLGTEQMSAAESVQNVASLNRVTGESVPEEEKIDVLVEVLRLSRPLPSARNYRSIAAVPQESKISASDLRAKEYSVLVEDILGGKKAVVMVEIFRTPDNADVKTAGRKQRSSDDTTSSEIEESTTASGISAGSETSDKKSEDSSSDTLQGQKGPTGAKRQTRSYVADDRIVNEEGDDDDMSVAETIIFRPLFSYRQDSASRRRSFRDVSGIQPEYDYY